MRDFLIIWTVLGVTFDLIFLYACRLMRTGQAGRVLQANYHRETRFAGERVAVTTSCVIGLLFPPYIIAGVIRFFYRARQEHARLREYGRE